MDKHMQQLLIGDDFSFYQTVLLVSIFFVLAWLIQTTVFWRLANRFAPGKWSDYFFPGYGAILLCRAVGVSPWCALGLWFLPTTLFFLLYIGGAAAERLGKSFWFYGVLSACGGLGLVLLALERSVGDPRPEQAHPLYVGAPRNHIPMLVFVTGEHAGHDVKVPDTGLVIGSDPKWSQFICCAAGVANMHVKITPDQEYPNTVVVEDLSSSQGTYYWDKKHSDWRRIIWPVRFHLYQMARLRIGAAACELEIHPG